nr:hypothetical protein CFP56_49261 [Quercus suber]
MLWLRSTTSTIASNVSSATYDYGYSFSADSFQRLVIMALLQSTEISALWLLKLSAMKYSADEHFAFLKFNKFYYEQSAEGSVLYAMEFLRRDILHF